MSVLVKEITHI